jgi:phosphoribosylglycinamide formyltransferase-1
MVSLVEAMQSGQIDAEAAVVLSNRPKAPGLELAAARGVPTEVVSHKKIRPREEHERAVIEVLRKYEVDLVCLAGYMRLLSPVLVGAFRNRIVNIHPSLLPAFPGLDAQQQALDYGVKVAGCTVHFVDEECDHGPIILQAQVPVREEDTDETLSARILEQEHKAYPRAVELFFADRLRIEDRRVRVLEPSRP